MLGYDSVSQEDFPTGYGELRQWLQSQIDSCEGVIQMVGQAYGAEPPSVDPALGRVSYTQFEFLYARDLGKKTWVIVVGTGYPVDKPTPKLDLPSDSADVDAAAYQAERHLLPLDYVELLRRDNHLRYEVNRPIELENTILRLRDDLSNLRQRLKSTSAAYLGRHWHSPCWPGGAYFRHVVGESAHFGRCKTPAWSRLKRSVASFGKASKKSTTVSWRMPSVSRTGGSTRACARPWRLHTQNG